MSFFYPLFYQIYRLNLLTVFLLMLLITVIWAALSPVFEKNRIIRAAIVLLELFIIFCILYYTVFRRQVATEHQIVLRPFASFEAAKQQSEIYREMTMNIFLFFPFGLLLPQILPQKMKPANKLLLTVALGVCLSVCVELLQLRLMCGDVETDDVIMNTFGVLIGTLHLPLKRLFHTTKNSKKRLTRDGKRCNNL